MSSYQPVNLLLYPEASAGSVVKSDPQYAFTSGELSSNQFLGDFSIYRARFVKVDNGTDVPIRINVGKASPFTDQNAQNTGTFDNFDVYGTLYVLPGQSIIVEKDAGSSRGVRAVYETESGSGVETEDPNALTGGGQPTAVLTPATLEINPNLVGDLIQLAPASANPTSGFVYAYPVAISG